MTLDPKAWRDFRQGSLTAAERRSTLRAILTDEGLGAALENAPKPNRPDDYGAAFDRGLAAALEGQAVRVQDAKSIAARVKDIEARASTEATDHLANEVAGERVAYRRRLAEHLRHRSLKIGFRDAAASVAMGRLAVAILALPGSDAADVDGEETDTDPTSLKSIRQARAESWAQLGNALRVSSDLRAADEAIAMALSLLDPDKDSPEIQANVLSLASSLRSDQSRFDEAKDLCERSLLQARRAGDRGLECRVMLKLASQHAYCSEHDSAINLLRRAQALFDIQQEPRLALVATHNLASYLNEAGRPQEAWAGLRNVRRQAEAIGNELDLLRLGWLEGRVQLACGRDADGIQALKAARSAFLSREMAYEMAQVSLELASHYAARGAFAEVRQLAGELVPVFAARDVHREARAALEVFVDAVRNETVERGLIIQVASYLERARDRPQLRFQ